MGEERLSAVAITPSEFASPSLASEVCEPSDVGVSALLERVRAATGPDHELDARIYCAVNGFTYRPVRDKLGPPPNGSSYVSYYEPKNGEHLLEYCPAVTASLDAALGLTDRLFPASFWVVGFAGLSFSPTSRYTAEIHPHAEEQCGATPALALLTALLVAQQARRSTAKSDGDGRDGACSHATRPTET